MNHIEWKQSHPSIPGPVTYYGYWDDAKCFSIHIEMGHRGHTTPLRYVIKSSLPGFRPDLPLQPSVAEAQVFAERMLQRWVAKRGLLFKANIIVTDAMVKAAQDRYGERYATQLSNDEATLIIQAAIEAREPHAARDNKTSATTSSHDDKIQRQVRSPRR